ncbi:hypothetical protein E2C01_094172 [Portunus trituberculatus]|uniref:Uncharacterized protein n=1 Tax=Portunus trituberculatus TaxID=210409 RepID=A0A5B7JPR1_PORTR|nr:hypothetical protein [Portunus trituberculatus]
MQENVILMAVAAQVTNGGGGQGAPRSLCLQPRRPKILHKSTIVTQAYIDIQIVLHSSPSYTSSTSAND